MNSELMKFVEWLLRRNIHFAVTSAFRTVVENTACNGADNSQHLTGNAIDLKPLDLSVDSFVTLIKESSFKFDQLIKYKTFIHISFVSGRTPRQMELNFVDRK